MPITYHCSGLPPIIRIVVTGVVSLEEKVQTVSAMIRDPALPETAPVMIDVNGATDLLTATDLQGISNLVGKLSARFGKRVAILNVVPGHVSMSHLVVGVTRIAEPRLKVCMSESEAMAWLTAS